jgi:hypothetical protein
VFAQAHAKFAERLRRIRLDRHAPRRRASPIRTSPNRRWGRSAAPSRDRAARPR